MAETAKIVNPDKKVLLPDLDAGCSLAESCDARELAAYKERHPGIYVVAYINCTAEVKALSDVICTSGNAERMVRARPGRPRNPLRAGPEPGRVGDGKDRAQDAALAGQLLHPHRVHPREPHARSAASIPTRRSSRIPECTRAVRMLADEVCSTEKMVQLLPRRTRPDVHHRHRIGHAPPPAARAAGQGLHSRPDRQVRLRRLPLHEDEHAGESLRRAARRDAGAGHAGGRARKGARAAAADARLEPEGLSIGPSPMPAVVTGGRRPTERGRQAPSRFNGSFRSALRASGTSIAYRAHLGIALRPSARTLRALNPRNILFNQSHHGNIPPSKRHSCRTCPGRPGHRHRRHSRPEGPGMDPGTALMREIAARGGGRREGLSFAPDQDHQRRSRS